MKKLRNRGFTLIELMIVVGIVAILASVAYPSYMDSIRKGKRAEGRAALTELMQQQERYMTQNNCYVGFTTATSGVATATSPGTACGGVTPATVPFKTFSGDTLAKAAYLLAADACPGATIADCVRVSATPVTSDPEAGTLQILSSGTKTCSGGSKPSVCWQ
ncbi:type IV pilin protein [Rhodoferax sp.]|uniref:type IV pilin protein n=1 Tax=Rhodoferax sp. TaxID=50421 RepID=UPI001EB123E8|nr:type IV pilin protein [Rhodoferax sp.]MBT9507120.1 type IV pilin protein [Rhodoferax sp.]